MGVPLWAVLLAAPKVHLPPSPRLDAGSSLGVPPLVPPPPTPEGSEAIAWSPKAIPMTLTTAATRQGGEQRAEAS